jgi:tRNA threonylcarbamoyl adenosine modification protein YeaZ
MILAIESASTDPSVAVAAPDGEPIAADGWSGGPGQGREILPRLLAAIDRSGRKFKDASAVAVGIGPGSFTGLRVGMSLAKGIAYGLRIPIFGIPSLAAWLEAEPDARAALARAGAREAFVLVRGAPELALVHEEGLPDALRSEPVAAPAELAAAMALAEGRPPLRAAAAVATLAAQRLANDRAGDDLRSLEPAYLRLPRGFREMPAEAVKWL